MAKENYQVKLTRNETTINQNFNITNDSGQAVATVSVRSNAQNIDPEKIAAAVAKAVNS